MDKKRVFIDMDGVLCEYRPEATMEDMEKDGYFRGLAPRKAMIDAVNNLVASEFAEVYVLSSVLPQRKEEATAEKNAWLNQYLPGIDKSHRLFPICGTNKADAVGRISEKDVLFDDYSTNLVAWSKAGGKSVKILNEVNGRNGTFKSGVRLKVSEKDALINVVKAM